MTERGWSRVGLYGGLLLSLAGNEAHVWRVGFPGWGPSVASVIWPGLLFIALEIVLHMGPGRRWVKWVGLGLPALVSGAVSYWHLSSVLWTWGYGPLSYFGPLAIDGLMVMSTVVLTASDMTVVPDIAPVDMSQDMDTATASDVTSPVDMSAPVKAKAWHDKARVLMSEGRTDADIAAVCGVSSRTVSRFRTSRHDPTPKGNVA